MLFASRIVYNRMSQMGRFFPNQPMYGMMGFQQGGMPSYPQRLPKGGPGSCGNNGDNRGPMGGNGSYSSGQGSSGGPRERGERGDQREEGPAAENPVVITHNLGGCLSSGENEGAFNLFSMIGKVTRIKYITNKQGNLLVQMATPEQAQHVIDVLNGVTLFGQKVHIAHARCTYIKESSTHFTLDKNIIKEYSFNPLNRCSATNVSIEPTPVLAYTTDKAVSLEDVSDFLTFVHAPKPKEIRVVGGTTGFIVYCDAGGAMEAAALVNNGSVSSGNVIKLNFSKDADEGACDNNNNSSGSRIDEDNNNNNNNSEERDDKLDCDSGDSSNTGTNDDDGDIVV